MLAKSERSTVISQRGTLDLRLIGFYIVDGTRAKPEKSEARGRPSNVPYLDDAGELPNDYVRPY
jgi:hypothetical protein